MKTNHFTTEIQRTLATASIRLVNLAANMLRGTALATMLAIFTLSAVSPVFAVTITSAASGAWGAPATWVGGVVPTATDSVIIASGTTVTINSTGGGVFTCASLVVSTPSGVLRYGSSPANPYTLTVTGNINVQGPGAGSGGQFTVQTGGSNGHVLNLGGNFTINGTVAFVVNFAAATINVSNSSTFGGNFTTSSFGVANIIFTGVGNTYNISSSNLTSPGLTATNGGLVLNSGTLNLNNSTVRLQDLIINGGTFNAGTSTLDFFLTVGGITSVTSQTFFNLSSSVTNTLNFDGTGGSPVFTIQGTFTIREVASSGIVPTSSSIVYAQNGTSTLSYLKGGVVFPIDAEFPRTAGISPNNLSVGANDTIVGVGNATVARNLVINSVSFVDFGADTLTVLGSIISSDIGGSGQIADATTLAVGDGGGSTQAQTISGNITLKNFVVNKTGALGGSESIGNTATITTGSLIFNPNGRLRVLAGTLTFSQDGRISGLNQNTLTLEVNSGGTLKTGGTSIIDINTITANQGKIVFNSISAQETLPTTAAGLQIGRLQIDNTFGVVLETAAGILVVNDSLILTNGVITTNAPANRFLRLGVTAAIGGTPDSSRMVVGALQRNFAVNDNADRVFPIGITRVTAPTRVYLPATINYSGANTSAGTLQIAANGSDPTNTPPATGLPAGISQIASSHFYTLVGAGSGAPGLGSYSFTGTYRNADGSFSTNFPPDTKNRILVQTGGTAPANPTYSFVSTPVQIVGTTTVTRTGITVYPATERKIVFGAGGIVIYWTGLAGTNRWQNAGNWSSNSVPQINDDVFIDNRTGVPNAPTGSYTVAVDSTPNPPTFVANTITVEPAFPNTITLSITANSAGTPLAITSNTANSLVLSPRANLVMASTGGLSFASAGYNAAATTFSDTTRVEYQAGPVQADDYGDLRINNNATTLNATGSITVRGLFEKQGSQAFSLNADVNFLDLKGNLVLSGSSPGFVQGAADGEVRFTGATSQQIIVPGGGITFPGLTINNANGVFLTGGPASAGNGGSDIDTLKLVSGIFTNNGNTLTADNVIQGGNAANYVNGALAIRSTGTKDFPIGKGGFFRPVRVTNATALTTAQNFDVSSGGTFAFPLTRLSTVSYFTIAGGLQTTSQVALGYTTDFDGVVTPDSIVVTRSATQTGLYANLGQSSRPTVLTSQTVQSNNIGNPVTDQFYTIGTVSFQPVDNPLPVKLADGSFKGFPTQEGVKLEWRTESEQESRGFILLRRDKNTSEVFAPIASYANTPALVASGSPTSGKTYNFTDKELQPGVYEYRLDEQALDGVLAENLARVEVTNTYNTTIKEFALRQNYPNPFNPQTTISYDILDRSQVSIVLYNALGQKVKELVSAAQDRGRYTVVLNASGLSSGVYFYRIVATGGKQNFVWSKKMTLLK